MTTREEIFNRKGQCIQDLHCLFAVVQNPIPITNEDMKYVNLAYNDLMRNIQLSMQEIERFLRSKEYLKEIEIKI
jgi:hypothetical protein